MSEEIVINFPLDQINVQGRQTLIYRPCGTRTLKVRITTNKKTPVLRLRPRRVIAEEQELGIIQAYADDSDAIRISWGGGHEPGPCIQSKDKYLAFETCVSLEKDGENFIYFNVTHAGTDLPDRATVTLEAFEYNEQKREKIGDSVATLTVKLERPPDMPAPETIARFISQDEQKWTLSAGAYLPNYDSRWWPAPAVTYTTCNIPPLSIQIGEGQLLVKWGDKEEPVATLADYTKPSVLLRGQSLAFELFHFDQWSVALRVWFFWHDTYISQWHEVPDAERFDMIIRCHDGRVLLAGTDLHWRESWARVEAMKALRGTLGMTRTEQYKLLKEKWPDIWAKIWSKLMGRKVEPEPRNNPLSYVRRLAEREATVVIRGKGPEGHIPMLHNVEQKRPARLTSSDVRYG